MGILIGSQYSDMFRQFVIQKDIYLFIAIPNSIKSVIIQTQSFGELALARLDGQGVGFGL